MKKTIYLFFVLILMFLLCGCYTKVEEEFSVEEIKMVEMKVNEKLNFTNINYEYNTCIIKSDEDGVYVTTPGEMLISSDEGKYYIVVKEEQKSITATADNLILIGDTSQINVIVNPEGSNQNVSYLSTDDNVVRVDENGLVSGISSGIARVIISSNNYLDITTELTFVVIDEEEEYYEPIIENIVKNEDIYVGEDITSLRLNNVIQTSSKSLVSITSYHNVGSSKSVYYSCGMIYKMNIHYVDGTVKEDVKEYLDEKGIKKFEYYVLTTASYAPVANEIKILPDEGKELINAEFIQYDRKTFISVLRFESTSFYPVAKIGDSDEVEQGDFIVSLGSGNNDTHFKSYSLGIVSGLKRYFSSDTDNDGISDWDDEYIQHDALIGRADFGGFIMNLKGEAVGINLDKLIGTNYNRMGLAKPINNVMKVVKILETGAVPERPVLGVSIFSVYDYRLNKDAFDKTYPNAKIPENLKYGMYITDVTSGGVADKCGVKVNDILVKFNGVTLKNTYDIRPQLANIIINSGTEVELVVLRDGSEITLKAVF